MRKAFLPLLAVLFISGFAVFGQDGHTLKFDAPGDGFVKSEDGTAYENAEDNTILKGILMNKGYAEMKDEVEIILKAISGVEVLSKGDEKLGLHNGFLVKMKREVDDENAMIQYMFIFPIGHGMVGNMTATFPESLTEKYADAMLESMGKARMVHNH